MIQESPSAVLAAPSNAQDTERDRSWFLTALLVATLLPALGLMLQRYFRMAAVGQMNAGVAYLASGFHVALSSYFYLDPKLTELRRQHPVRFFVAPLTICVVSAGLGYALSPNTAWLVVGYLVWQIYHYQRQNFGVMAFVAASLGVGRTNLLEQSSLEMAGYAGILGYIALGSPVGLTALGHFTGLMLLVARAAQISALALAIYCWWARYRREGWSWYSPWHLLCASFFLATFLQPDANFAFMTYAFGHGLQYIVFMFVLASARSHAVQRGPSALILARAGVAGSLVLIVLSDRVFFSFSQDLVFGLYLGLVMTHFVIDAMVWRLSEPMQRQYVRDAFTIVWPKRPSSLPAS
jgi:hypothetical protein